MLKLFMCYDIYYESLETMDSRQFQRIYIYMLEPCDLEKTLDLWNIF